MSSPTFAALVLLALFIGRWQRLGNQGPQVAVAALFAYQSMIVVPTWRASFVQLDEIRECLSPELLPGPAGLRGAARGRAAPRRRRRPRRARTPPPGRLRSMSCKPTADPRAAETAATEETTIEQVASPAGEGEHTTERLP